MIGRVIGCLFLALGFTNAVVEFHRSKIFDEFDFKGKSSVTIDGLCSVKCFVYASVTPESKKYAANLLIQQPKGFVSVADIAAKVDLSTGQKGYLEVTNTASLSIVNANAQNAAGPLVLYVVFDATNYAGDKPDIADNPKPEVYEAEGMIRPVSTIPQSITVMSARPFTLTGAPLKGNLPQGVFATMSGYDDMEYAQCPYLYYVINPGPFPGFTWHVNGPIISLEYDTHTYPYPPGELAATIGITNTYDIERSGWVGSPGYHGCSGKQPYRSSLYDFTTPFHAEIASKEATSFGVTIETNSDDAHAVKVTEADTGVNYSIGKTAVGTYVSYTFVKTQNVTIDWMSDGTGNIHFLARYRGFESRFLHPII